MYLACMVHPLHPPIVCIFGTQKLPAELSQLGSAPWTVPWLLSHGPTILVSDSKGYKVVLAGAKECLLTLQCSQSLVHRC